MHGGETPPMAVRTGRDAASSLRILAVGNMYPPENAGGYEIAWQQAMAAARDRGHRVRILTTDCRTGTGAGEEDPDVHRTLRWYWDLERYEFPKLSFPERLRLERHNAGTLTSHLRTLRPDVVTWWSMGGMSLAMIERVRRLGLPAVFVVHDDWLDYGFERDQWLHRWQGPRRGRVAPFADRACGIPTRVDLERAGRFVFNSQYTLDHARQVGLLTPHATVVHPGIDERFLEPEPVREWSWRLAYVGRIDRQKGIDTVIRALAGLPETATLSVWGSGDEAYLAEMTTLAARLGLAGRVRFEGFVRGDAVHAAYGDADVVVFPVRWNEPFGLVPLEAMGVGRPVVTTAHGGTKEFVRDGENALVFAADDPDDLVACVQRLAADPTLRERLRRRGAETAARFTATRYATLTVDEIEAGAPRPAREGAPA